MLLSLPTWIIHLLTVSEWTAAMVLLDRYGRAIDRRPLRVFALCMLPHLLGGLAILVFHVSGDRWDSSLVAARALTFLGSLLLLAATLSMLPGRSARMAWLLVPAGLAWGLFRVATSTDGASALLPGTNALYLGFLVALLFAYRADRRLFSPLTLFGFWFLLVFVVVTLFSTQIAVERWGLPSLSHADALHGGSEALLSLSNLMIALGVAKRLNSLKRAAGECPAQARAE
ncbi:MAG: DUF2499 domain-containing protein [Gammaproteobacteria bacterium]|jgi:hypothetical protein|nr:DUF2499 domain-containing protein [Gammaproteobacteria bacterium]